MEIVEVLQQASYRRKRSRYGILTYLLARITLTLMSFFAITSYFQKVNFQAFNLIISNSELPSAFLYALCELLEK